MSNIEDITRFLKHDFGEQDICPQCKTNEKVGTGLIYRQETPFIQIKCYECEWIILEPFPSHS